METSKDVVLPPRIKERLKEIITNEGYKIFNIHVDVLPPDGGNFLGVLYEVTTEGITFDGLKNRTHFFIKYLGDCRLIFVSVKEAYMREIFSYSQIFKYYQELEIEANIPVEERYKTPKYYGEVDDSAIILEDLTKRGFKVPNRMETVPLKLAELAVENIAKFHSLAFALEKKHTEFFKNNLRNLDTLFNLSDEMRQYMENASKYIIPHLDNRVRMKVKSYDGKIFENFRQNWFKPTSVSCLCHGDFRLSNILMRETNGEIADAIVIDYQFINYGSPMNDFFFLIFSCTDKKFRRDNMENLKIVYYDSMKRYLKYLNIDVESAYPRDVFESDYRDKLELGLPIAMSISPFVYVCNDDAKDISERVLSLKMDDRYVDRMKGVIEDYIEWGYL